MAVRTGYCLGRALVGDAPEIPALPGRPWPVGASCRVGLRRRNRSRRSGWCAANAGCQTRGPWA